MKPGVITTGVGSVRGFTLIEVVVSLALIAMIAAALTTSLRFGQRSYEQVTRKGSAAWDVFASQRLIRRLVESADVPDYGADGSADQPSFNGRANSMSLLSPAPLAQGGAGLYRYELAMRPRGARSDFVVRWATDLASNVGALGTTPPAEEVLIDNVAAVEWSYLPRQSSHVSASTASPWLDQWSDTRHLPAMVRLKVRFHVGDAREWPDLIVTPRNTDSASCVFDVVSQSCRGNS